MLGGVPKLFINGPPNGPPSKIFFGLKEKKKNLGINFGGKPKNRKSWVGGKRRAAPTLFLA